MKVRYKPELPDNYRPPIGLIGCGGITKHHLAAYQKGGLDVVALCDIDRSQAESRRAEFYPNATVTTRAEDILEREDIEVVDIATHPAERPTLIQAALRAGKHVLSQKPFVLDLDVGESLVAEAAQSQRVLAVNQNGRWAPHFSYASQAVRQGLLGDVMGVHLSVHWDHSWVAGTPFAEIDELILYDYAIHWFDIVRCLLPGQTVRRVYASTARSPRQTIQPPLLAQALIECDTAQASLAFDADCPFGAQDRTFVAGTLGSFSSVGPGNSVQQARLTVAEETWEPTLEGRWFSDGFLGTMGELLGSIAESRPCTIAAEDNLKSLALCFAAVESARRHEPVEPGTIRRLRQ